MSSSLHTRGLTSLLTFATFLLMTASGLVAYLMPQGRVAYWVHWQFLGLSKTQWGNFHIISSLLFAVAVGVHLFFNWQAFLSYLYHRVRQAVALKRELALTGAAVLLIGVSAIYRLPPLSYLVDLNTALKDSWISAPEYEPPFGHAELLSLEGFSRRMDIDPNQALAALQAAGLRVSGPRQSLEEIALANETTPMALYRHLKPLEPARPAGRSYTAAEVEEEFAGTGIGQQTVSQIAREVGQEPADLRRRLARQGLDAAGDETLKQIAARHGRNPLEVLKILLVEDYRSAAE